MSSATPMTEVTKEGDLDDSKVKLTDCLGQFKQKEKLD